MTRPRAVFLDRDGVINVDTGYAYRIKEIRFLEGIFEFCKRAERNGYSLVIATNQSGIARGYFTEMDFHILMRWMLGQFAAQGISFAGVYFCPFHPEDGIGEYKRDSELRKPKPGMILQAQRDLNLDLGKSILIGDKLSDIEAANAAGIGTKILLDTELGEGSNGEDSHVKVGSLHTALKWIEDGCLRNAVKPPRR